MKNQLLNKYLFSSYVASVLFIGATGAATFFAEKEVQMLKTHSGNEQLEDSCKTTCLICLFIATVSIVMGVFSGVKYPMVVRAKTKNMTKHYLQDIFVRYPETRPYRFILEDSKKLQEIAAIACNGLTDDEQKEILDFVDKEMKGATPSNNDAKLHRVETFIMDVIQKHAAKNPEYMKKILWAVTIAEKPNVFEAAQKVR